MLSDKKPRSKDKADTTKRARKKQSARLCRGDRPDRRPTDIFAPFRNGTVSDVLGPPAVKSTQVATLAVRNVPVDAVRVMNQRRPLRGEKVDALKASMEKIGLKTPITVQKQNDELILVAGWHRLEAARRLGWRTIPCFLVEGDDGALPWRIIENLHRAELTVLERAD